MLGSTRVSVRFLIPAAIVVALAVCLPTVASAATFGSECTANLDSAGNRLIVQTSRSGAPVKTAAPGVITRWTVVTGNVGPATEKLKVLRAVGEEFEAVAESEPQTVPKEARSDFPTRIPVPAGVQFGIASTSSAPLCYKTVGEEGDSYTRFNVDIPVGGKAKPAGVSEGKILVALAVTIEPDADGDGFGDETQDKCPTNAATQGACPSTTPPPGGGGSGPGTLTPSTVAITGAQLEGNTVAVKLTSSAQAQVTVTGSVKGKQAASASTVTVAPGAIKRAYLTLTQSLLERLKSLPRKQHLNLVIEAETAGAVPVSRELELPGRKHRHRRHRHRSPN